MRNLAQVSILGWAFWAFAAGAVTIETAGKDDLAKFKKQPCTLLHLWASWCAPCVQELPTLLPELGKIEKLTPVVIDVSTAKNHERDSKPLLERIAPTYTVYKKAGEDDDAFLAAVDPKWSGALPYSVLYNKGKVIKKWEGPIKLDELRKAVAASCKAGKGR